MKLCRACGIVKPLDAFFPRRVGDKVYRRSKCKECGYKALNAWQSAQRKARREAQGLLPRGERPPTSQCVLCGAIKPIAEFLDSRRRIRRRCIDCLRAFPIPRERQCVRCGVLKSADEFAKTRHGTALRSWCRVCNRLAKAEWYQKNIDRVNRYTDEHRETKRQQAAEDAVRRRARFFGALTAEKIDRAAIIARDGGICYLCGAKPTGRDLTLDHVIPLYQGGLHTSTNLRVACRSCNSRKGARLLPS